MEVTQSRDIISNMKTYIQQMKKKHIEKIQVYKLQLKELSL